MTENWIEINEAIISVALSALTRLWSVEKHVHLHQGANPIDKFCPKDKIKHKISKYFHLDQTNVQIYIEVPYRK